MNLNWQVNVFEQYASYHLNRNYDWILTVAPRKKYGSKHQNYLILFDPENHFFDQEGHLKRGYQNFSGYLTTYENTEKLLKDFEHNEEKIYPNRWYPTAPYHEYRKVVPTRLFYIIGHWGDRKDNPRYQTLQSALAQTSYTALFGNPKLGRLFGKAFKGEIPYDGVSVINKISEMGVCLVLHSEVHLKHHIPSGRIFEAAASSAVIISDMNPFVIKHFGDSVFYMDHTLSGEEMFEQIDTYMEWIRNHPEEALQMAKKSHQIFVDNFLLEQQLLDFDHYQKSIQFKQSN